MTTVPTTADLAARVAAIEANGDRILFSPNACCGGLDYLIVRANGTEAVTLVSGQCGGHNPDPDYGDWAGYEKFDPTEVAECLDNLGWAQESEWMLSDGHWRKI